jgi:hypothetical protein
MKQGALSLGSSPIVPPQTVRSSIKKPTGLKLPSLAHSPSGVSSNESPQQNFSLIIKSEYAQDGIIFSSREPQLHLKMNQLPLPHSLMPSPSKRRPLIPLKLREETAPRVNFSDQLTLAGANCQNVVESMMKRDPYYQKLAEKQ